jgi:hypothetical protein
VRPFIGGSLLANTLDLADQDYKEARADEDQRGAKFTALLGSPMPCGTTMPAEM